MKSPSYGSLPLLPTDQKVLERVESPPFPNPKPLNLSHDMTLTETKVPVLYSKAYFIAKFEAQHEENFITGAYRDEHGGKCAVEMCGGHMVPESDALYLLLVRVGGPQDVNDGKCLRYQQPTPKARILAALKDLPDTA